MLKEEKKKLPTSNLCPQNLWFRIEEKIKDFPGKQKLKEFTSSKTGLL